jgi:hypothetical protein
VLLPYATDPYTGFFVGIRHRQPIIAAIALTTVLGDFLPLLLSNVPFNRAVAYESHRISSWISVGILTFMVAMLVLLIAMLVLTRPKDLVDLKTLKRGPIACVLMLVTGPSTVLRAFPGLSLLGRRERDARVRGLGLDYRLVRYRAEDNGTRLAIDVQGGGMNG